MQNNTLNPILGNTTKATIINILSQNPPLTLKQLHTELEKQNNKPITYQATHKAISEMITDTILEKTQDKKLQINKDWITKGSAIFEKIKSNSHNQQTTENVKVKYFNNYSSFSKYIINSAKDLPNPENRPCICIMKHSWVPLGLEEEDFKKITNFLKENQYYDLTTNSTPLDLAFAKTLEKMGKNVIVGSKIKYPYDLLCKGDTIIQIIFDKKYSEDYDKIFKKHKKLDENSMKDIIDKLVSVQTQIQVTEIKNEELSKKIQTQVLKEYKKVRT